MTSILDANFSDSTFELLSLWGYTYTGELYQAVRPQLHMAIDDAIAGNKAAQRYMLTLIEPLDSQSDSYGESSQLDAVLGIKE